MEVEVALLNLSFISLLSIFIGAFSSVEHHKKQMASYNELGEKPDIMSNTDALIFPIQASGVLIGLYFLLRKFSNVANLVVSALILSVEVLALSDLLSPVITKLVPEGIQNFHFHFYSFDTDIISLLFCSFIGDLYIVNKHWLVNNLFAIAYAVHLVGVIHLNNVETGSILLGGLSVYDIIFVFGTDVMTTVVMLIAPVKLLFPVYGYVLVLENGAQLQAFSVVGLADVVVPGIFNALLLRFDNSLNRGSRTYFNTSCLAYMTGLFLAQLASKYRNSQPGLLYLVPCCVGIPMLVAFIKGDLKAMLEYEDYPSN